MPPTALSLVREGLARVLDGIGIVMFGLLGWQVMFGGSQLFERESLAVALTGAAACVLAPRTARSVPVPMLAYVGIALLSSAVHRWPDVATMTNPAWSLLLSPAMHLVVMALFVFGGAHLIRTPTRLALFAVSTALAIAVIAVRVLLDRITTNFAYSEGGSQSLPSVAQWGGMHQIGMLLVIAFPLVISVAFLSRSRARIGAGLVLGGGLLLVAILNGSRSAILTMVISTVAMAGIAFHVGFPVRWKARNYIAALAVLVLGAWLGLGAVAGARRPLSSLSSGRLPIWTAATQIIRDHPWLGVGPGNYRRAMVTGGYAERFLPRYASRFLFPDDPATTLGTEQAHNMLLHVGAETGVFGAASLLALFVWMIAGCWRSLARSHLPLLSCGLLMALAAFLLRSMYDNFLDALVTTDRTRVLVWMLFAAALALIRLAPRGPVMADHG